MIDLRSDTVTKPTPEMRAAMAAAEVDDDVIDADPTVRRLQDRTAELLGKEAALYVPSGTMANQIAVRLHCGPGDELLCEAGSHVFHYEQGGFAQLSGVVARTLEGKFGVLELDQFRHQVHPDNEHLVRTRLVWLENTHNRGGGRIQPPQTVAEICGWAHGQQLATHLDGARLWNAAVATGLEPAEWARPFDTVSVCFSKGLGAPVGSALAGPRELIAVARRHRKLFGGGMRQAGIIAAGALYALDHHLERLAEDHQHARILADAIRTAEGLTLHPDIVDTNMVIFRADPDVGTAAQLATALKQHGVWMLAVGPNLLRAVTHLDVSAAQIADAARIIPEVSAALRSGRLQVAEEEPAY